MIDTYQEAARGTVASISVLYVVFVVLFMARSASGAPRQVYLVATVVFGVDVPLDLLYGSRFWAATHAGMSVMSFVLWRRSGGGKGGGRRLKSWTKSKLPKLPVVRLRPALGATPA